MNAFSYQFPTVFYNLINIDANLERTVLDLNAFSIGPCEFAEIQIVFFWKGLPTACDAYVIIRESGTSPVIRLKDRLQNKHDCVIEHGRLAGFNPTKCSISVAVDRDISCGVGATLKEQSTSVMSVSTAQVISKYVDYTKIDASTEKQEPICTCDSLLWGHHRDCKYAARNK